MPAEPADAVDAVPNTHAAGSDAQQNADHANINPTPVKETSAANTAASTVGAVDAAAPAPSNGNPSDAKKDDNLAQGAVTGSTIVAPDSDATPAISTPSTSKKANGNKKRASSVSESKAKRTPKGKAVKEIKMNLDCKPGQYYWARLKGHPPWPSIICDEEMLPEAIITTRPVTALRADGTYRDDYKEGGKNAKDRTYPIMYLGTNEFSWMPNTDLDPIDFSTFGDATPAKKSKSLTEAYEVAKQEHDLSYYKNMLYEHAQRIEQLEHEAAATQADKEAKQSKKGKRKSKADVVSDEDVDLDSLDVPVEDESEKKIKPSNKRKKSEVADEDDDETAKPAKTPKKTPKATSSVKLNLKTPATASEKKPKATKASGKKTKAQGQPQLSAKERLNERKKQVLYLRHKLQRGLIARQDPPGDADMEEASGHITTLEGLGHIEPEVIRETKVHKLLKAILKLEKPTPGDDAHDLKKRCSDLLAKINGWLASDDGHDKKAADVEEGGSEIRDTSKSTVKDDKAETKDDAPTTNGTADESKTEADKEEEKAEPEKSIDGKTEETSKDDKPKETKEDESMLDVDSKPDAASLESEAANAKESAVPVAAATESEKEAGAAA